MGLKLNQEKLMELMQAFYTLTDFKIAIFDSACTEIAAYPQHSCSFCAHLKASPIIRKYCMQSDADAFDRCRKKGEMVIYHCHAGLVEAAAPIKDNGVTIGFIMIGQVSDHDNSDTMVCNLREVCRKYNVYDPSLEPDIQSITYKSPPQIQAAAKILEACTLYVVLKELVLYEKEQFVSRLNSYIDQHVSEAIPITELSEAFHVSRSKLYEMATHYLGIGLAEYILERRIQLAKIQLRDTNLPITEIAFGVGFSDYNYFCRVFKRKTGYSSKDFRRQFQLNPNMNGI